MFISSLTERGATPALLQMISYTQQRHAVIAENIANVDTPGYKSQTLDIRRFQQSLQRASEDRKANPRAGFVLRPDKEFEWDASNGLRVRPRVTPQRNAMLQDGTTISIEREMSDLAANAMMHQAATVLLKGRFDSLMTAIRGRL